MNLHQRCVEAVKPTDFGEKALEKCPLDLGDAEQDTRIGEIFIDVHRFSQIPQLCMFQKVCLRFSSGGAEKSFLF